MAQQLPKWSRQHNRKASFPLLRKTPRCTRGTTEDSKHFTGALLTARQPVWSENHPPRRTVTDYWETISEQTAHYHELPQSRAWRDSTDGWPCRKRHWSESVNHSSLLPHVQSTLYGVCHSQKFITSAKTFLISEQGCWKHTPAFLQPPKRTRHQTLKNLGQYTY